MSSLSIRARTTVAATIAAGVCFGAGALWLRHEVYTASLETSVVQTATGARELAVAHASGDVDGLAGHQDATWVAIDNDHRVRATNLNRRMSDKDAPVVLPDPLMQQIDPSRLESGGGTTKNDIYTVSARIDGKTDTFVVTYVFTGSKGQILLEPPIASDGSVDMTVWNTGVGYYVEVPTDGADAAMRAVDPIILLALPAATALIAAVAWYSVGRALKPVGAITGELTAITSANLDRRVPVPATGDEIADLATTTNATLDRLEDAVTRQRRFVADAAHELRSPLAALRNTVEVARATTEPADLDVVLSLTRRLQDLTDDLLLLARLDRAETRAPAAVDLAAIVDEQVAERRYGGPGPVAFTADAPEPVVVTGDQRQLERLLRNLLDNAARHANTTVTVTASASGDDAVVEVLDDGEGIAEEDRERVFQPFTRLDDARARDSGGTGLGLAIVRTIAAAHGGRIEVDNAPGARFTLRIPRRSDMDVGEGLYKTPADH